MNLKRFTSSLTALAEVAPSGLLCNLLTEPDASLITETQPDFGWIVPSSQPGDMQTAYQILLATSSKLLKEETADLWDSGKVVS